MNQNNNKNKYDLEQRTYSFARDVREFLKDIPNLTSNFEDAKQLSRSSGSVAANYIEANEALSKKDFCFRIKICRKEAKESAMRLKLISINKQQEQKRDKLIQEATELMKIMSSIMRKSE